MSPIKAFTRLVLPFGLALTQAACLPFGMANVRSDMSQARWVEPQAGESPALPRANSWQSLKLVDGLRIRPAAMQVPDAAGPQAAAAPDWVLRSPPLSPGDRVRVFVNDGEEFSGLFELDMDGSLQLPYLPPLQLAGQSRTWAERRIADALVNAGYFRLGLVHVSLRVQQWSSVQVNVSGAVFDPGMVTINVRNPEERAQKSQQITGDFPPERLLQAALRAAGGVRPDADILRIVLVRDGQPRSIDFSGVFEGLPVPMLPLMAGDSLIVPSTGRFDEALVSPSPITPPGIRVFLSNLTVPATDNSKSALGKHATSLPYGTRMLTALVSANCVGGTAATNSSRYGVMITRNPLSGETEVIHRSIEELMMEPGREELNPHVMPHDGLACYDSGISNLRDIARAVADVLLPIRLGR